MAARAMHRKGSRSSRSSLGGQATSGRQLLEPLEAASRAPRVGQRTAGHDTSVPVMARSNLRAGFLSAACNGHGLEESAKLPSTQHDVDAETIRSLAEMGFSRERISRVRHELPTSMSPSLENLLQALFQQTVTPPPSRPPSASLLVTQAQPPSPSSLMPALNSTSAAPKSLAEEFRQMGFSSGAVSKVMASVDANTSLEQALEVLLTLEPTGSAEHEQELHPSDGPAAVVPVSDRHAEQRRVVFDYMVSSLENVDTAYVGHLLLLIDAALSQKLITEEQRLELHQELQDLNVSVVEDFLAIIQVRHEPGMPLLERDPRWECPICLSEQEQLGWQCPEGHQFCHRCMGHHVEATIFPSCPHVGCGFGLEEADLLAIQVPLDRLESFQQAKLRKAVDSIGISNGHDAFQEVVIHCQGSDCTNAATIFVGAPRCLYACPCGEPSFCTQCRQTPYHFHAECSHVQTLRRDYLDWVSRGRESYFAATGISKQFVRDLESFKIGVNAYDTHVKALKEAILRHRELEKDEAWKARNCRLCPGCRRPLEKLGGCDSMVCGQNFHGGNEQPGCGTKFNWSAAEAYVATATHLETDEPTKPTLKCQHAVRGAGAFHPFIDCSLCGSQGIAGPRFRCIHCESFSICSLCEPRASTLHSEDHVFEIMYESDTDWSQVPLPVDTPVRIVRCNDTLPPDGLEGFFGAIQRLRPLVRGSVAHRHAIAIGQGVPVGDYDIAISSGRTVNVSASFLEPLIDSREKAQRLLDGRHVKHVLS